MPEPHLLGRATLAAAALSVVGYLVAAVVLAVPVAVPEVQDCGAPGAYVLTGRLDVVPDAEDRIVRDGEVVTLPAGVADAARARPCQDRVADRAVPAGVVLAGAFVVGAAAFVVELAVVRPRRRRALAPPA